MLCECYLVCVALDEIPIAQALLVGDFLTAQPLPLSVPDVVNFAHASLEVCDPDHAPLPVIGDVKAALTAATLLFCRFRRLLASFSVRLLFYQW